MRKFVVTPTLDMYVFFCFVFGPTLLPFWRKHIIIEWQA